MSQRLPSPLATMTMTGFWTGDCGATDFEFGPNPATKIYHNNHDGMFTDIGASLIGTWYGSVEWGDL